MVSGCGALWVVCYYDGGLICFMRLGADYDQCYVIFVQTIESHCLLYWQKILMKRATWRGQVK